MVDSSTTSVAGFVLIFWYENIAMRMIGSIQFFAEVFNGFLQTDFERYSRLPIQYFFRPRYIWFAPLWVIFNGWHCLDLTGFAANQITNNNSEFCEIGRK